MIQKFGKKIFLGLSFVLLMLSAVVGSVFFISKRTIQTERTEPLEEQKNNDVLVQKENKSPSSHLAIKDKPESPSKNEKKAVIPKVEKFNHSQFGKNSKKVTHASIKETKPTVKHRIKKTAKLAPKNTRRPATSDEITSEVVKHETQTLDEKIYHQRKFWIFVGVGGNYVRYNQSITDVTDLTFQSLKLPTFFFNAGGYVIENVGFDFGYNDTLGGISNTKNGQGELSYHWKTISADGLWRITSQYQKGQWSLSFGVQHHFIPFLAVTDVNSETVELRENTLTMFRPGFSYIYNKNEKMRFIWKMGYQHPLASGAQDKGQFDVTPSLSFDGSIGIDYFLYQNYVIGFSWYGQLHSYKYTYQNGSENFSGKQELFYSNFNLRFGLEF